MSQDLWSAVDRYLVDHTTPPDPALDAALAAAAAAGLPPISVSPALGKLLQLLARLVGARAILEVGTLAGYSTIWMARALPEGGRLVTLEADPRHAAIARANIADAGLAHLVDVREGLASESLPRLLAENAGPFDLVFIDADKIGTAEYFGWALDLARPGSLIVVDNVVRKGAVIDPNSADPSVLGMRRFFDRLAAEPRVGAAAIQTVGVKGHDGLVIARVN